MVEPGQSAKLHIAFGRTTTVAFGTVSLNDSFDVSGNIKGASLRRCAG
jgi:hypothetical protein